MAPSVRSVQKFIRCMNPNVAGRDRLCDLHKLIMEICNLRLCISGFTLIKLYTSGEGFLSELRVLHGVTFRDWSRRRE
jgi:hypothetical protein